MFYLHAVLYPAFLIFFLCFSLYCFLLYFPFALLLTCAYFLNFGPPVGQLAISDACRVIFKTNVTSSRDTGGRLKILKSFQCAPIEYRRDVNTAGASLQTFARDIPIFCNEDYMKAAHTRSEIPSSLPEQFLNTNHRHEVLFKYACIIENRNGWKIVRY